jgi:hypothetical protein
MKILYLLTIRGCDDCLAKREELRMQGVAFVEVDVTDRREMNRVDGRPFGKGVKLTLTEELVWHQEDVPLAVEVEEETQ